MINSLQIIVFAALFFAKTPKNALIIQIEILALVSFDPFNVATYMNKILKFDLEKTPPLNSQFEEAGFDTSNFVLGIGTMFLFEIGLLALSLVMPLARRWASGRKGWLVNQIKEVNL